MGKTASEMTPEEFGEKCEELCERFRTLYVLGMEDGSDPASPERRAFIERHRVTFDALAAEIAELTGFDPLGGIVLSTCLMEEAKSRALGNPKRWHTDAEMRDKPPTAIMPGRLGV